MPKSYEQRNAVQVIDLRLAKIRQRIKLQAARRYHVKLSPLVERESTDRILVTNQSDTDLVDRIKVVLTIPDIAEWGALQDEELIGPIAYQSGKDYLWLPIFRCHVFYNLDRDKRTIELQCILRDRPGPSGPDGGDQLVSAVRNYLTSTSDSPLARSNRTVRSARLNRSVQMSRSARTARSSHMARSALPTRSVPTGGLSYMDRAVRPEHRVRLMIYGLMLAAIAFGDIGLSHSIHWPSIEQIQIASPLNSTAFASNRDSQKGDLEGWRHFENGSSSFRARWSDFVEDNNTRWTARILKEPSKREIVTSPSTAMPFQVARPGLPPGRGASSSAKPTAAPIVRTGKAESPHNNLRGRGYTAQDETPLPSVDVAQTTLLDKN
jgi:hypothetical protein